MHCIVEDSLRDKVIRTNTCISSLEQKSSIRPMRWVSVKAVAFGQFLTQILRESTKGLFAAAKS